MSFKVFLELLTIARTQPVCNKAPTKPTITIGWGALGELRQLGPDSVRTLLEVGVGGHFQIGVLVCSGV